MPLLSNQSSRFLGRRSGNGLKNGLLAYWPLSESSDGTQLVNRAELVGGYTATDNNNVPSAAGKITTNAAHFARADSPARYFTIAANSTFDMSGKKSFTVAAWVKLDTQEANSPRYSYIISNHAGGGAGSGWMFFMSSDTIVLQLSPGDGTTSVCHAGAYTYGTWALVFGWYDPIAGKNCGQVYPQTPDRVDDTKGAGVSESPIITIGCQSKSVGYRPWDGEIGPIMLWNRVLSDANKTALYNNGAGLVYADFS